MLPENNNQGLKSLPTGKNARKFDMMLLRNRDTGLHEIQGKCVSVCVLP